MYDIAGMHKIIRSATSRTSDRKFNPALSSIINFMPRVEDGLKPYDTSEMKKRVKKFYKKNKKE